jgi:Cu-Zn family superoxide dismutase
MTIRPMIPALLASLALSACAGLGGKTPTTAEAQLAPTKGGKAAGSVRFVDVDGGVRVEAIVSGLTPGGHGFHVHEKGDCSAPDAMSAGGHFNPTGKPHAHPDKADRHLGDMPMLMADAGGRASLTTVLEGLSISGDKGVVGRAVIVHAAPDDFVTQPTGNSGARVACGVVAAN